MGGVSTSLPPRGNKFSMYEVRVWNTHIQEVERYGLEKEEYPTIGQSVTIHSGVRKGKRGLIVASQGEHMKIHLHGVSELEQVNKCNQIWVHRNELIELDGLFGALKHPCDP